MHITQKPTIIINRLNQFAARLKLVGNREFAMYQQHQLSSHSEALVDQFEEGITSISRCALEDLLCTCARSPRNAVEPHALCN